MEVFIAYLRNSPVPPRLWDRNGETLEGPFRRSPRCNPGDCHIVGYIAPIAGGVENGLFVAVYMAWAGPYTRCPSHWPLPLPDRIWGAGDAFFTSIRWDRLDFTGTAFEQRHTLAISETQTTDMIFQADLESVMWNDDYETLVPFKTPHPRGYQGVYGSFGIQLKTAYRTSNWVRVFDAFDGHHLLELC